MLLISCRAHILGHLFFNAMAIDIHTAGCIMEYPISLAFLVLMLAILRTARNNGVFFFSSLSTSSKDIFEISFFDVTRRRDGYFEEQTALHSLSTSRRKSACSSLLSLMFRHAADAICLYVPLQIILPRESNVSGSSLTTVLLGHSTETETFALLHTGFITGEIPCTTGSVAVVLYCRVRNGVEDRIVFSLSERSGDCDLVSCFLLVGNLSQRLSLNSCQR